MKKIFALVMTMAMVSMATLTGCGGASKTAASESQAATAAATETKAADTEAAETEGAEPEVTETAALETEAVETVSEEDALVVLGHVEDNVYTNAAFDLHLDLSDAWHVATPEEIAQLMDIAADRFDDKALAEELKNSGVVYDLYATNQTSGASLTVILENTGSSQDLTADDVSALIDQVIPELEASFKNAGCDVQSCEPGTVTFRDEEINCVASHVILNGNDLYQREIFLTASNIFAIITVSASNEAETQDIINAFKPVTPEE